MIGTVLDNGFGDFQLFYVETYRENIQNRTFDHIHPPKWFMLILHPYPKRAIPETFEAKFGGS